jgi:hypothetical protein
MAIERKQFDNEQELDKWVQSNYRTFFGDVIYIPGNFFINTKRNKGGKPDGFVLDLNNSSWTIVEAELLKHGVWDHIAEQIVRFIVAARNSASQRKIRDLFFDEIEARNIISSLSKKMNETESRLLQKIETIIESQTPDIAVFIDEINEDFEDMVEALNATVKVFTIQKYLVNGTIEYLSPQGGKSIVETTIEEVKDSRGNQIDALEVLGGGVYNGKSGNIKLYTLNDSSVISIKYSKRYDIDSSFWYGITPSAMEKYRTAKINYLAFIMGEEGVLKLPFHILEEYIAQANTSNYPDGSIKHYHIFIKEEPEVTLYTNQAKRQWNVSEYYYDFEYD